MLGYHLLSCGPLYYVCKGRAQSGDVWEGQGITTGSLHSKTKQEQKSLYILQHTYSITHKKSTVHQLASHRGEWAKKHHQQFVLCCAVISCS